jgi:hypothetical protein
MTGATSLSPAAPPGVFFGGPDCSPRALRDLLEARVEAVPPGGAIDWMTYYCRARALAGALARAHRRGVAVRLCLEGAPRRRGANDAVIRLLRDQATGIGGGLRVVRHWVPAHLHTKLYAFSHPEPHALVGSFNPSGDVPEDAAVVAEIGDQDRGHNLLVSVQHPPLLAALLRHVAAVHAGAGSLGLRRADALVEAGPWQAAFFPWYGANPLDARLAALRPGAALRIVASHVRDGGFARQLAALAQRGVRVAMVTHHTLRRTPRRIERTLLRAGIGFHRWEHPEDLPMHNKFLLAEDGDRRWSAFGSYNFTRTSRWLNGELLVFAEDAALWTALERRWTDLLAEPWTRPGHLSG